jgi:DNA end-binding protein Ku
MPRAIWSGSISFGLVNVPVKLYSAVSQKDLQFHQLEESTGSRIRYKRVSEKSGREVPYEKIVKGYEVGKGKYVMLTPEELEAFEPDATRTIDIEDFVDLDEIDPIYFDHTYYLAPANDGASKAYTLLLKAMEEKGKVGIGRMVMRTKQYLAAVRPLDGVLAISTMLFGDEVVDRKDIDQLPAGRKPSVSKREADMAGQIIDSLSVEWDPKRYEDTYREKVLELIAKKAKGEEIVSEAAAKEEAEVVDLMAALEASLDSAKNLGKSRSSRSSRSSSKAKSKSRPAAKKRASGSSRSRAKTRKSA